MAKITVRIPELRFRKEEMQVPVGRAEQVKQALAAQQERITQGLIKRNAEVARQLDKASGSLPSSGKFTGMLRLSRQNAEAARKLDEAAAKAAASRKGGSSLFSKLLLIGIGALVGAGTGILSHPRTGPAARALVTQKGGKAVRTAGQQGASVARTLTSQAKGKASAVRAKVGSTDADMEPETITDRVRTEIGENESLRHLPRINVNTEPGGVVYLRGVLPGEKERELAEKIARKQRGVSEVVNEINVEGADAVQ